MTTTNFTFTITRRGDISQPASVEYEVTPTNRFPVVAADFAPDGFPSGVVNFASTETSKTVTIAFDGVRDATEFAVNLKNPVGGEMVFRRASAIALRDIASYINKVLGASLWLDAADDDTVLRTNNFVYEWRDKSGNNRHLAQSETANQPTYSNSAINFDGGARVLERNGQTLPNNASIFLVASYNSINVGFQAVLISDIVSTSPRFYLTADSGTLLGYSLSYFSAGSYTINTPEITNFTVRSSSAEIRRNGVLSGVLNSTGGANNGLKIGTAIIGANRNRFTGFIREVVVFEGELGESDRQIIEGYLAHKWNLVASLHSNHPYKSVAPF